MHTSKRAKALAQTTFLALIATVLFGELASTLWSAETKSGAPAPETNSATAKTNSVDPKATPPEVKKTAAKRQLSGAELYSMHCNRCHPERYPTERTAAQWKTIMLHMEVRANLPRSQARLILKYLQENSGR
jgi:cell division protein FtsN